MAKVKVQFDDGTTKEYKSKKEMLIQLGHRFLSQSPGPMTLRQLYYQFVGADLIDNKQSQYQYLGDAMKEARLEGRIPWDWIEDRNRSPNNGDYNHVDPDDHFERELKRFKKTPKRHYRRRWEGQTTYVEAWVEKQALAGVFSNICSDLKVVSFPCQGYPSITMLKDAAERFRQQRKKKVPPDGRHKKLKILYFGDYDPSGQDIERNIRERLRETFAVPVEVERVALTEQQIKKHQLPPQPAKSTDARYEQFVQNHGNMAVELDALPPQELRDMIREAVEDHFDEHYWKSEVKPKQEEERQQIQERIDEVLDE